ncbi:amino acid aminotransferase [Chitinimonas sp. BJB300]|uniref:amino acid aminotransferase n=1 Tax=Chitinimonas sp. BJB300 TaxID=1559339 RepID=UPI000C0C7BEA|nr:aromatic amino acid transaminase [Chitinimonas sp. BJB300]PHV12599.1 aromatic amino acid aminotransferase [Chitinimonas sp. BJB300]TSJ89916.1 aspartate/tyrosine/aromatic aminotransferase [Chitinimonas sp. BJB300]
MFQNLVPAAIDPILSVAEAFREDPRPHKLDLGVGVYRDVSGNTPVMAAVRQAERWLVQVQTSKSYIGLAGNLRFNQAVTQLVLGHAEPAGWFTLQTPGASGGLRLLADLIAASRPTATVWISDPSYVNHAPIMRAAGLQVGQYPYLDATDGSLRREAFFSAVAGMGKGDVLLLHGCCHNPSGVDLEMADWQRLAGMVTRQGFVPFVDLAYHGFGAGLEQDTAGLRLLADASEEMLVVYSCSKHFGLYRERTGAALVKSAEPARLKAKLFELARHSYTMPPDHGAEVVAIIMESSELAALWRNELDTMRERIQSTRDQLANALAKRGMAVDNLRRHKGMFSMLPLGEGGIAQLRNDAAIYIVAGGRINLAGLDPDKIDMLADAVVKVS